MNERDEFFANIKSALGRPDQSIDVEPVSETGASRSDSDALANAQAIKKDIETRADELLNEVATSAETIGWNVVRVKTDQEAAEAIQKIARSVEARKILRSTHDVLERLDLEADFKNTGIDIGVMAISDGDDLERQAQRQHIRDEATVADIGITGVDYAIAETGSCVIVPRQGVARTVSLLPPVHIAVVERGQVIPSLDELFSLRRDDFLDGNLGSYMNIISGPSRSADIEYTLVTGVHGPGEVHMILIG